MSEPASAKWRWRRALRDLGNGLAAYQLWVRLAYEDVRQRYIRSVLGEFWISLSMGISIVSIGVLYGSIFKYAMTEYLPYLAAGVAAWTFIAANLNEGANAFIADYQLILQSNQPTSIYLFRVLVRNLIVYAHNVLTVIVICAFFGSWPTWTTLMLLPNLAIVVAALAGAALTLAVLATRYRDIGPILANILQLLFFLTPIIWMTRQLPPEFAWVVDLNPFRPLVELLRDPLIGKISKPETYIASTAFVVVTWAIATTLYARTRHRIAFWL